MPKVDISDWKFDAGHHGTTGEELGPSEYKLIAQAGGLTQFGAHIERLPPGSKSSPRHHHSAEDEMVLMLSGEVVLIEEDEVVLRSGDAAAWPAQGPEFHCMENRSAEPAVYLVVGTKAARDVVTFADHDLVLHLDHGKRRLTRTDGSDV